MAEQQKTTVEMPSSATAKVTGPATVEAREGASISAVSGPAYYQAFEKYGFAGLVAILFGVVIYNQIDNYAKLMTLRESDQATAHAELKDFRTWAENREEKARDREDKMREQLWKYLSNMSAAINKILWRLKIETDEPPPFPKKGGEKKNG